MSLAFYIPRTVIRMVQSALATSGQVKIWKSDMFMWWLIFYLT